MASMSRAATMAEAAAIAEKEEALRKRAARQAVAQKAPDAKPPEMVTCRVLKAGDGKVSMGEHVGGVGDAFYEWKETFRIERAIATDLEDKGYIEIEGEPKTDE